MTSKISIPFNIANEWLKCTSYVMFMLDIRSTSFYILAWHIKSMFIYINETLLYNYPFKNFSWYMYRSYVIIFKYYLSSFTKENAICFMEYTLNSLWWDEFKITLAIRKFISIFQRFRRCTFRFWQQLFVISSIIYKRHSQFSSPIIVKFY